MATDATGTEREEYDVEAAYDAEVLPLLRNLMDVCERHRMDLLCTVSFSGTREGEIGSGTTYLQFAGRFNPAMEAARIVLMADGRPRPTEPGQVH